MKIKKKLRDVTEEEFEAWKIRYCKAKCANCTFCIVNCSSNSKKSWVNNKEMLSDRFLNQEIEIEITKPKLTEDEKVILKNLDKDWKYIARNKEGLYIFTSKPHKEDGGFMLYGTDNGYYMAFLFNKLFKFIQYADEEPYLIEDLLKEEQCDE